MASMIKYKEKTGSRLAFSMRAVIVVLSMFAVALCAPVGEKADILDVASDDMRVKRAKETIMFGNQQNDQQRDKAKRTDPSENVDEKGYIVAQEPSDLVTEDSENDYVAEETLDETEETMEANDGGSTETEDSFEDKAEL